MPGRSAAVCQRQWTAGPRRGDHIAVQPADGARDRQSPVGPYFGRPLAATASNFGAMGERPTHPELLDDLTLRFLDSGWSLKWLTREIVLSAAYQEGSGCGVQGSERRGQETGDRGQAGADPENYLLGHFNRRRMTVEQWRDSILAATGRIDPTVGGKSIDPQQPTERRRTVYSRA